jgi:hypothetical protein
MKQKRQLHIVSFNVPHPPDYGGVIDIFYKLKSLSSEGIAISLHCFHYGRRRSPELERYASKVFYYPRHTGWLYALKRKPYIVAGRNHPDLLDHLLAVKAPILFEGLHSCYYMDHPRLAGYRKILRMHNVEHAYYEHLAAAGGNIFRRHFFRREARKLKNYEPVIQHADALIAISPSDRHYFEAIHPDVLWVPGFHPHETVTSLPGKGSYFLYHGNLGVAENLKAVHFLLDEVIGSLPVQFVIAGKNPPGRLLRKVTVHANVRVVANPSFQDMERLIGEAQGCILPTFQATGLKLKLLASLYSGRFCLVNSPMVADTGLEDLCIVADTADTMQKAILETAQKEFTLNDVHTRMRVLGETYANQTGARTLINKIYSEK